MKRRDFLKNSIGALLFCTLDGSKIINETIIDSPKVLLYLIQNYKGQWKIRATKWVDIPTKKLDPNKVKLETFKPLEIIDNDIADKRKNELWIKHNCSGEKGGPLNIIVSEKRARMAHISPKMKKYRESDQWRKNWEKGRNAPKEWSKELGKRNKESGWMNKIRPENFRDNFNNFTKEQRTRNGILGGKAASILNLQSGQVMMAQKLAGESRRKKVINIETNEIYNSLREVSNLMNYNYGSFKNKMSNNSGRKNNTPFRYY